MRARWAARRAAASETGASDGAWLGGDAAAAIACDAAMAPVVTGDVNVDALDDLVRLCVELDRLRRGGGGPDTPAPGTTAAWAAVEQAVIGKAVDLLSGPGGLASFLRRRQLGVRLGGPSLPLDIGYAESIPAGIRNAVLLRDRHCQWAGGCTQPAGACEVHHTTHKADGGKTSMNGLRAAVPVPPPGRHSPVGLDAGREPGRDDQRVEQEQDQSAAQPRTTRPRRVKSPACQGQSTTPHSAGSDDAGSQSSMITTPGSPDHGVAEDCASGHSDSSRGCPPRTNGGVVMELDAGPFGTWRWPAWLGPALGRRAGALI